MVQANGIDLSLFQFDYDLTFAAFFMNADRTIYGRYGTNPSQENPGRDISLQGFIASLEAALKLHGNYPEGKEALLLKSGRKSRYPTPE
ncbi:MAG: thioredoxin family protein, partial [Verrucomicrobiota bacterium]|nr:thioredoxin family protein [Verrucomicrobiota bacterium]